MSLRDGNKAPAGGVMVTCERRKPVGYTQMTATDWGFSVAREYDDLVTSCHVTASGVTPLDKAGQMPGASGV